MAIRIGNLLGANLPHKAKRACEAAQMFTVVVTGATAVLLQVLRRSFGHLFSKDPLVIEVFDRMVSSSLVCGLFRRSDASRKIQAWLVAIVAFFDGIQGACTGILKGGGLPTTASRINLFSYWLVGLPVGALVTLKIQKIEGLWVGLSLAVFFASSLMLLRIWR